MNAGLAKLIHAIWFIRAPAVDLDQSDAVALFPGLASWLRDHPPPPGRDEIAALHNQKILTRLALTNQRKRPPERRIGVAQRRGILEIDQHGLTHRDGNDVAVHPSATTTLAVVGAGQPLARASPASRTSILRNAMALATRSGKSSRSVALPACMSIPSGSQPVQRQSADSAPSSWVA
jgi:hypothetical protein